MNPPKKKMKSVRFETVTSLQYDIQLAANIVKKRMDLGWTQKKLAKKLGIPQPAIARAENGVVPPSHKFLKRLAEAFGCRLIAPDFREISPRKGK